MVICARTVVECVKFHNKITRKIDCCRKPVFIDLYG